MKLKEACRDILEQLNTIISQIKNEDYGKPVSTLNNSTIGQHIRHTLEFFTCLINNYETGIVNYDNRDHDKTIENDKEVAELVIQRIHDFIDQVDKNKTLTLHANYDLNNTEEIAIQTNLERELAYNIEHAIHHMAIIKIGVNAIAPYIQLPKHFGIATSTLKFKELESSS